MTTNPNNGAWPDAPEWANYRAMDGDGYWYWFENRPMFFPNFGGYWYDKREGNCVQVNDVPDESGIDWDHAYDTLEARPK